MPTPTGADSRLAAARALAAVIDGRQSLTEALPAELAPLRDSRDRALARRLVSDTLRQHNTLEAILAGLLKKPLAGKDRLVHHLLAVGIAQLRGTDVPPHAAVFATVEAAKLAGKAHLKGLVNGVLKQFQRRAGSFDDLQHDPALRYGYPQWWVERLESDWPAHWETALAAGNQPPPTTLRINRRRTTRDDYLRQLREVGIEASAHELAADALVLAHPVAIARLPGFDLGLVSVQDAGAQLAADYLDLHDGQRVLDACAAPGGKTCHILERAAVDLTAVDLIPERLAPIHENLNRLGLECQVCAADAGRPDDWWDGVPFDRILIDAPCSSSGVVRRHPDIRWLRRESDLPVYAARQRVLLAALWPLLKPGGILVYATCSVFSCENAEQGRIFLDTHTDAEDITYQQLAPFASEGGSARSERGMPSVSEAGTRFARIPPSPPSKEGGGVGNQIFPGDHGMDGFYYLAVRRRLHR